MTFFPTAGFRHRESGALDNIGSESDVWGSAISAAGGFRLLSYNALVCVLGTSRGNGFSLRCVQAFMDSVSGRSSSRLRVSGTNSRVRPSSSVLMVTTGHPSLQARPPCVCFMRSRPCMSVSSIVLAVLVCVVSKRLRILFRAISSRLRGTARASRECYLLLVPKGTVGHLCRRVSVG